MQDTDRAEPYELPASLEAATALDARLTRLAMRFNAVSSPDIAGVIDEALAEVMEELGADRATLTRRGADGSWTISHSWSRDGVARAASVSVDLVFPWAVERTESGRGFLFRDPTDLPEIAASEREWFERGGVRAHITVPLAVGGSVLGGLHAAFMRPHDWADDEIVRVQRLADLFAAALARSAADEALRRSEELNLAVLASLPDPVAVVDGTGALRTMNQAWRASGALLGIPTGELVVGDSLVGAWADAAAAGVPGAADVVAGLSQVLTVRGRRNRHEHPAADDPARWLLTEVSPLKIAGGGAVVMHLDITERRQRAAQLEGALARVQELKERFETDAGYLRTEIDTAKGFGEIIGGSGAMQQVLAQVHQVAPRDTTVLLLGETGTGKELLARALHDESRRAERPLVTLNCAALPPSLVESELFGYERGAFTGADERRRGHFEVADGGTIFLDEIGELDEGVQTRLLRVLQEGEVQRLGAERPRHVDVRVIAATNRDLGRAVAEGRFRQDLFYRLNVFPIRVPPLRDRPEDITALTWHFVQQLEPDAGRHIEQIRKGCMRRLQRYPWPGNVRELRNVVERALVLGQGPVLELGELVETAPGAPPEPLRQSLDEVMRHHIVEVLEACGGVINGPGNAADRLGIHPNTLRHRMKKLGIERP